MGLGLHSPHNQGMPPVTSVEEVSLKAIKFLYFLLYDNEETFFIAVSLYKSLARIESNQLEIGLLVSPPQHGRFPYVALTWIIAIKGDNALPHLSSQPYPNLKEGESTCTLPM